MRLYHFTCQAVVKSARLVAPIGENRSGANPAPGVFSVQFIIGGQRGRWHVLQTLPYTEACFDLPQDYSTV